MIFKVEESKLEAEADAAFRRKERPVGWSLLHDPDTKVLTIGNKYGFEKIYQGIDWPTFGTSEFFAVQDDYFNKPTDEILRRYDVKEAERISDKKGREE